MNRQFLVLIPALMLAAGDGAAQGCVYKPGESKFLDYAICRYGEDAIETVQLPEGSAWETCIYFLQAFRPPKLLAVTKQQNGGEVASINDRSQIGNPCYLTKRICDAALEAAGY
jgi:hypothetical protein